MGDFFKPCPSSMNFSKKLSNFKQSHLYRSRKISENAQNTQLIINGAKQITTNHPCDFKMIYRVHRTMTL
jgi:hypothetical protein